MARRSRVLHRIPLELSGLATLMVDYLSRWGEEMELLSVFLATLIIGVLLDQQGIFDKYVWGIPIGVIYAIIVALEFIFVTAIAYKRRELENDLWVAVQSVETGSSRSDHSGDNE